MTLTAPPALHTSSQPLVRLTAMHRNGVARLSLMGELDSSMTHELSHTLDRLGLETWRAVLVDAYGLSFMDSAGVRLWADVEARCERSGGVLAIARCGDPVRRVFSLLGYERLLGRECIAIAIAYSEVGPEPAWSPLAPDLGNARSA